MGILPFHTFKNVICPTISQLSDHAAYHSVGWSTAFDRSLDLRTHFTIPRGGLHASYDSLGLRTYMNILHRVPFHGFMITHFTSYHPRICELASYHFVGPQTPILPFRGFTSTLRTISCFTSSLRAILWPHDHASYHLVASRAPILQFGR